MGGLALAIREVEFEPYGGDGDGSRWDVPAGTSSDPDAGPDHASDPDALEALGDEIATLAAHIHAATHRLLELIARFDRLKGWEPAGHRSCAYWLAFRTGMDLHTAREHVRVARALEDLPATSASMAKGRLSFSKVRALTRVAKSDTEADLLELAEGATTAQLERMCRAWKKGSRQDEAARERERHLLRRLSVFPDDDGMYLVRGRLEPEVGALLMRAIEAASDTLYREERREGSASESADPADAGARDVPSGTSHDPDGSETVPSGTCSDSVETPREAARRRADALGLLAERALAAGFEGESPEPRSEALAALSAAPISGTRAGRYQVLLHVDAGTLSERGEPGRSHFEDGTRVSAGTSRRLACDASVVRVTHDPKDDAVLDVGRRTRTIPPALRRALEVRDHGCRFPGCGLRFADAHHVVHWADGGETSLENTLLLCRFHHRLVHEEGWRVEWWGKGRAVFRDPRGGHHFDPVREEAMWRAARTLGRAMRRSPTRTGGGARELALQPDPTRALVRANRLHGADPGPLEASGRWKRERDIPNEVWFRATEAGLEGEPDMVF